MPGILYVVATPIGNLEDVTLRALRVLREVALIAAEDTRRTARLLQHYSIPTPTTSLHEHNEWKRTPALVARLSGGDAVALVSDAGTPSVSDPGARLVAAAHEAGIRVEPVPGASAAVAALSASGVSGEGFVFVGFPPNRSVGRRKWLQPLSMETRPVIMFEAPHRLRALLADLLEICGDRRVLIARELTKVHEELVVRPITAHLETFKEPRGEFTLVIHPGSPTTQPATLPLCAGDLRAEFGELTNRLALTRRQALKNLAEKYGVPTRTVYRVLENLQD